MLGNVDVLERRHPGPDGGGGEHVALGVPAEPPDLVLASMYETTIAFI